MTLNYFGPEIRVLLLVGLKKWDQVLNFDWSIPKTEWFINGKLNITVNCSG